MGDAFFPSQTVAVLQTLISQDKQLLARHLKTQTEQFNDADRMTRMIEKLKTPHGSALLFTSEPPPME
jgi:hypothetical protein